MNENKVNKSEAEWKKVLNDEQFRILRKKGTEMPFSGPLNTHFEEGIYNCAACKAHSLKVTQNLTAAVAGQVLMPLSKDK